jgi:hypothetical protein
MPHYRVTDTGLMIPVVDSSKGEPRFKCTVITGSRDGENTLCGKPFWEAGRLRAPCGPLLGGACGRDPQGRPFPADAGVLRSGGRDTGR